MLAQQQSSLGGGQGGQEAQGTGFGESVRGGDAGPKIDDKIVEACWEVGFLDTILEYLKGDDVEEGLKLGIKLSQMLAEFKSRVSKKIREMIDEICLPKKLRQTQNLKKFTVAKGDKQSEPAYELRSSDENYLYRIAIPRFNKKTTHTEEKGFFSENSLVCDEIAKLLALEFKGREVTMDVLMANSKFDKSITCCLVP